MLLADPLTYFSAAELAQISEFARLIGLEWGGVDVLRDRTDGRLPIVDANKTDMGPPIALQLARQGQGAAQAGRRVRSDGATARRTET